MITYRYGPYKPDDDQPWDTDRLMSILSDMIMKYDIHLEEALRMLIDRGLPVNLFLKEGGMDDLVSGFMRQLDKRINDILKNYTLSEAVRESKKDVENSIVDVENKMKSFWNSEKMLKKYNTRDVNIDQLFRMKWELLNDTGDKSLVSKIDLLIKNRNENDIIESASIKYIFEGSSPLSKQEALAILEEFEELEKIKESLRRAIEEGDLFNFDLEKIAKYLGPESYQEFLERREHILEEMEKLLQKKGNIVQNEETGEWSLSPAAVKKIGRRALEEIFTNLKSDTSGGTHETDKTGESENSGSKTRSYEFGDSLGHIDISGSVVNALIRSGKSRPNFRDLEIFEQRGSSKNSTIVLLDMSGSMLRSDRFFNAKKMVLALDSLIREEYRDDRLNIVGFGSLAKSYSLSEIPTLQPFPVTIYNPHIRFRFDLEKMDDKSKSRLPLYFTNLQRGLQLSRSLLGSGETKNKQIILITDGVPTAHFEGSKLCINYPPSPADFEFALREVRACSEDGIVINTFLLTSDWEMSYFGEESFISQFAKQSMGRIFYPGPGELDHFVVLDFIQNKKSIIKY